MVEIVGIGFMNGGKSYYFDPEGEIFELGELVIVETARGLELGHVLIKNMEVDESELKAPLKPIIRKSTEQDISKYKENQAKKPEAIRICQEKIQKHKLNMKLIDAEYTINGSKLIFYFSSDGRVDFRELVKDLASYFHTRIELRQIGVRDEARIMGGIGICGRPFCCHKWLHDFEPVSIKMAKQQNISLNPAKISGSCGRLMCCLNYENDTYKELSKGMPSEGERIMTPDGLAKVCKIDLFSGKIMARLISKDEESGEDTINPEVNIYFKKEIKKIEKKKHKNSHSKDEYAGLSEEEKSELEKLKMAEE